MGMAFPLITLRWTLSVGDLPDFYFTVAGILIFLQAYNRSGSPDHVQVFFLLEFLFLNIPRVVHCLPMLQYIT